MRSIAIILQLFAAVLFTDAYKSYQEKIPNGANVRHPCYPSRTWEGVGHRRVNGGGSQNPFGVDFVKNKKQWNKELCSKDSDGDGRSNGEELGDPQCQWKEGQIPQRIVNITHPGVCEPLNSEKCKTSNGQWDICQTSRKRCRSISSPDVFNVTYRFSKFNVPTHVTNYLCQAFTFPNLDSHIHLVASQPLIENAEVLHHMILFGCKRPPRKELFRSPVKCSMSGSASCNTMLGGWTLGDDGDCWENDAGILIGKESFSHFVIEMHLNNIQQRSDMWDTSGMRVFFSKNLRSNNISIGSFAQGYLEIPPGRPRHEHNMTCSSECTRQALKAPVNITHVFMHMHYLGMQSEITQLRNGRVIRRLIAPKTAFSYNEPYRVTFDPPVEYRPGDAMHVKCIYNSIQSREITYFGLATADEMCIAFFAYYPARVKFPFCWWFGPIDYCKLSMPQYGGDGTIVSKIGECNMADFIHKELPIKFLPGIQENCHPTAAVCLPQCRRLVEVLLHHKCMQDWSYKLLIFASSLGMPFSSIIRHLRVSISSCVSEIRNNGRLIVREAPPSKEREMSVLDLLNTPPAKTALIIVGAGAAVIAAILVFVFCCWKARVAKMVLKDERGMKS